MELEVIVKMVFIGLAHLMLVRLALENLVVRQRVLGGRKAPWVVAILFITLLGPLSYWVLHPQTQSLGCDCDR